jgi:excisionase family DNA binding protein
MSSVLTSPPATASAQAGGISRIPRIGLTRDEAAEAIGISARTIDTLIADRTSGFPVARIGARVVIPLREFADWLSQQAKGGTP